MSRFVHTLSLLIIAVLILSACNLPSNAPATEGPDVVFTAAALTLQAQLTQPVTFSTPTLPPAQATNTPLPTALPATKTPVASATAVCDQAEFIKDVTIPDGSTYAPGASFTKTWRLRNAGTCTWSGYSLVFDSGDAMNGTSPTAIGTVTPGQEVDLSVTLTAPATSGSYRGHWRIRNATGVLIPVLGGTQGKSFFVDIKVAVTSAGFDLHAQATSASWISCGSPCGGGTTLTFGGPDTDANGFAMYRDNQKVEGGGTPAKILEMHPMWVDNGVITGLFPNYTVVAGEHFKARIGFLALADGTCGTGNVKFQLNYKEAGVLKPLGEWAKTCDGAPKTIDVDLSSLAGKTVQFALGVLANGPAAQDWAVWINPRVELP